MSPTLPALPVRALSLAAALTLAATVAGAQRAPAAQPKHPAVCAKGVRVYTELSQIPVPHDTLQMPPSEPVRVTNEQEAEAAELAMRGRAGSVGATGVLISDKEIDSGDGQRRLARSITAVFVPAEAERSQQACK